MPTVQGEKAVTVTVSSATSATRESSLERQLDLNNINMQTDSQKGVDSPSNTKATSGNNDSPVSVHQLQSMLATIMTDMQEENAKLASNVEAKVNKLSDDLDVKLSAVAESLDTKFNAVSDRLDARINVMIVNATSEMGKENDQIRQEFSMQLQTEVQLITQEVGVIRNSIDTGLNNCVETLSVTQ
jgi:hypothetical protein